MCGVSRATVAKWQQRAANTSSNDANVFTDRRKGRPAPNRTPPEVEQCILATHGMLLASDLGEHGAAAIHRRMRAWLCPCLPCVRTVNDMRQGATAIACFRTDEVVRVALPTLVCS